MSNDYFGIDPKLLDQKVLTTYDLIDLVRDSTRNRNEADRILIDMFRMLQRNDNKRIYYRQSNNNAYNLSGYYQKTSINPYWDAVCEQASHYLRNCYDKKYFYYSSPRNKFECEYNYEHEFDKKIDVSCTVFSNTDESGRPYYVLIDSKTKQDLEFYSIKSLTSTIQREYNGKIEWDGDSCPEELKPFLADDEG